MKNKKKKTKFVSVSEFYKLNNLNVDCETILMAEVKGKAYAYFSHHIYNIVGDALQFWTDIDDELMIVCEKF